MNLHRLDLVSLSYPGQVAQPGAFRERWPATELTLHFHNTRGLGLANVLTAIDAGADRFDASLGGIGGCPYAPGATGNVCSEEIVHALDIPSQIVKAGRRVDLHAVPADFSAVRERALARDR